MKHSGERTLSIKTLSITTLSTMTLSITTLSITTLSITTLSIMWLNWGIQHVRHSALAGSIITIISLMTIWIITLSDGKA